jgi:hypothetical protein
MFGTAIEHNTNYESSIKVTTEELHDGKHSVYFNSGITGSQAYTINKEYGNKPIRPALDNALFFLGRDLWSEGLLKFVRQATNNKSSI